MCPKLYMFTNDESSLMIWVVKWKKSSLLINILIQKMITAGNIEVTSLLVKREELKMHGAGNHQGDTDAALLLLSLLYYNYNFVHLVILIIVIIFIVFIIRPPPGRPEYCNRVFLKIWKATCRGKKPVEDVSVRKNTDIEVWSKYFVKPSRLLIPDWEEMFVPFSKSEMFC